MLVQWNSHSLAANIQNKCFSERSCLDAWLMQFPLFPAVSSSLNIFFTPAITKISEQILIETGRKWRYIDKVPLSSRFYKVLFIDYTMDKQKQEKRAGMAL